MQDMVITGTGNSRFLKSVENFLDLFPTYEAFAAAFASGVLPVDFNGINPDGITQIGTPYSKSAVLTDETAALFGLDNTAVPDDVLRVISSGFSRIAVGTVTGSFTAGEDSPNSITFPFKPKLVYVTKTTRSPNDNHSSMKFDTFLWTEGVAKDSIGGGTYGTDYRHYKLEGNTLSWWVSNTNYLAAVCGQYVALG